MEKIFYYVLKENNVPKRVAKNEKGLWYGFEKDKWKEMPELVKIAIDTTDYEPISEVEANKYINWQKNNWNKISGR